MDSSKKVVLVRGKVIGGNQPLICTPLVGSDVDQIMAELEKIRRKEPDIIEWRADFFSDLDDSQKVIETASKIRELVGQIPILFTIRSQKEGGQPIALEEKDKIRLISDVCKSNQVDLIDYEMDNEPENIHVLRQVSREYGVSLILSYHNFYSTPDDSSLVEKLLQAESYGADIAKIAVMPTSQEDVLVLLKATQEAQKRLKIPMVTMSMGRLGAITRMFGWVFGSNITFAIGEKSSAPGQIPIEDLRSVIQTIQKSIGNV
ncbi:type I 3-dehydroquinate dehydratase [Thermoflavimicrobium dichotomicum]|uniref:3-dehydroquinate dehydratase n=1 Tax=Thermoflavimicrobium dichotomicum TaxID=46223 RepID=A0A1I3L1W7_9BACL|nr:type I 3-dehydroquinate dehydratase [Thermoflavimicrobium dichotomicum]SFI78674.1 3-dehydroquinate dehydratase [Thermoflavimicrobium dichotomicum]